MDLATSGVVVMEVNTIFAWGEVKDVSQPAWHYILCVVNGYRY
jgi:hypothetical protein